MAIHDFHEVKWRRAVGGHFKPIKCGLGQIPRSFAILGHYSIPDGLKLKGLSVQKLKIGKIFTNKTISYLPLPKRKKVISIWLKVNKLEGAFITFLKWKLRRAVWGILNPSSGAWGKFPGSSQFSTLTVFSSRYN